MFYGFVGKGKRRADGKLRTDVDGGETTYIRLLASIKGRRLEGKWEGGCNWMEAGGEWVGLSVTVWEIGGRPTQIKEGGRAMYFVLRFAILD